MVAVKRGQTLLQWELFNRHERQREKAMSTREERQQHVDEINTNMRASGIEPDSDVLEAQRHYIDGTFSTLDLLDWAAALQRKYLQEAGLPVTDDKSNQH